MQRHSLYARVPHAHALQVTLHRAAVEDADRLPLLLISDGAENRVPLRSPRADLDHLLLRLLGSWLCGLGSL